MKPITPLAVLVLLAGPAFADTWRCQVPYDEVNGGGHVTLEDDRMVFVSDWPHRDPEIVKCIRAGLTSECMSADLVTNRDGGASVFAKLYSIVWQEDGAPPTTITTRQLRLVSPNRDKRVVILSNLPLPGFPITRLATLSALERDLEHEPDLQGFIRMEDALRATMRRPVRGTRLSAAGLAADLPRDFKKELGAKRFRRGRPTSHLMSLCQRVAAANNWQITPVRLRRSRGGKAVPALILDDHGAPLAMAKTLWPDFTPEFH